MVAVPNTKGCRVVGGEALTRWQRSQAAVIAGLGAPVIGALCRTLRWRVEGAEHYDAILAAHRQPIFAFWHGRVLAATYFWRDRDIVVMTSQNFDGEWIARIIRRWPNPSPRPRRSSAAWRRN